MSSVRYIQTILEHLRQHADLPPIIGRKGDARTFREEKLALKAEGYPVRKTRALVKKYMAGNLDRFTQALTADCILVPVPSGSGKNLLTEVFAVELSKLTGASLLSAGIIGKTHHYEAKNNLSLLKRVNDPIGYHIDSKAFASETHGKKVIIVDDLIGSGESCVQLKRAISRENVRVHGFANLLTVENYYPTINDLTRFVGRFTNLGVVKEMEALTFAQKVFNTFGDFTRQKMNRVEREIRNESTAIKFKECITKADAQTRRHQNHIHYGHQQQILSRAARAL